MEDGEGAAEERLDERGGGTAGWKEGVVVGLIEEVCRAAEEHGWFNLFSSSFPHSERGVKLGWGGLSGE